MGQPCSGLRSLITILSLGLAYVYLNNACLKNKIILVTALVPLALIGNLARVLSTCLVAFYFGDSAGQKYHDASGILIFLVLICGLIGIEALLEKR